MERTACEPVPHTENMPHELALHRRILDFCSNVRLQHLLLPTAGMKGTFRAASRRQKSKSSPIVIGVTARERERDPKIDGSHPEPVNHKNDERTECQATQPAVNAGLPIRKILQTSESRKQWVHPRYTKIGPPVDGDWTPGTQGLDPRCAETGPPRDKATGPGIPDEDKGFAGPRTSQNPGLRGIRDFLGFKTSWDMGLRGIQDSAGNRNFIHLGPGSCSVVFSMRTNLSG